MVDNIYEYLKLLQKIEVEFESDNNKYTSLKSYIKSMTDEGILIDPPGKDSLTYNIPVGNTLKIFVYVDNGDILLGECIVTGLELSTISGIWISYPLTSQLIQRREFVRVPLRLKSVITLYKDINYQEKTVFEVLTRDISGNGLSYISDNSLDDYYDINCQLFLNNEENPLNIRCEHVHSSITVVNNSHKFINAFTFIDLPQQDVKKIVQECFKYQLKLREKGLL